MKRHGCSALALLAFAAQSCGARSGFDVTSGMANGETGAEGGATSVEAGVEGEASLNRETASGGQGAEDASPGNLPGPILCALNAGPVAACAPTPQTGPIQICGANFPACAQPRGFNHWACCTGGGGPYDGPTGDCRFPSALSSGCP
jgi:hypothetical protein